MNLANKRIVITRPQVRAIEFSKLLETEGAIPIFFPVIQILPLTDFTHLDEALRQLSNYQWLVLTSVHAVEAVFSRIDSLGLSIPTHLRIAVVGTQTQNSLANRGIDAHFIPEEYTAQALAQGLAKHISANRVLLPQSNLAANTLTTNLHSAGVIVHEIIAYHTLIAKPEPASIQSLRSGVDIITFASPSSVHGFVDVTTENKIDIHHLPNQPRIACIGQVTATAAREVGIEVHIQAQEHTVKGLLTALKNF